MKKLFFIIALAAFATASFAQDAPKKPSCSGFVSNGFWDNWEVSVGAGVGVATSNGTSYGKGLGVEGNVSITKWLHPVFGLRAQLQGGEFSNTDPRSGKMTWPYMFAHTDLMINASNWIGGYREDRAYYAVPFVGFGYMASNFTHHSHVDNHVWGQQSFAFTYGILNKFRLSEAFDFNIELKGMFAPSRLSAAKMNGAYLFGFSATAGFTYRFNKRGFQRGVAGYTAESVRALQDAVAASDAAAAAAKKEVAGLNDQLKAARAEAAAAKAQAAAVPVAAPAEPQTCVEPTLVILYDYSMSKLTDTEKTRLGLIADQIKDGPKGRVYHIEGHADAQTGTPAGNKRIAENRAKGVYEFLVGQGVNPDQLTYVGKGDTANPYVEPVKANRAAIVK